MVKPLIRIALSLAAFLTMPCVAEQSRYMAITFDDLPIHTSVDKSLAERQQITAKIIDAIVTRRIEAVGFVNERQLYPDSEFDTDRLALLLAWIDARLELGNHSYSHPDLHRTDLDEFKKDVLRGETNIRPMLTAAGMQLRWFRHPYLHTGRDLTTKTELEAFLQKRGYAIAPVSIDNQEWIFARAYDLALQTHDEEQAARIGADYVDYMVDMLHYYEEQSKQIVGRNIKHVLLLHANALNADYFGTLGDRYVQLGYTFVSLDEALEDDAYRKPDTYTGPGGITWLHRWALTADVDRQIFAGEPEVPKYILEFANL